MLEYSLLRTSSNLISHCYLLLIIFFISTNIVIADSRQIIDYGYDASGNLTDISPEDSNSPPNITQTEPDSITLSGNTDLLISGNGLRNASVTSTTNGIDINVLSSTNNTINLHINLDPDVPLGTHSLIITTSLGSSSIDIQVLPSVAVYPGVVTIFPNNSQALALNLNANNNIDRIINLQVEDSTIATVTPTTITLQAGQTHYSGNITVNGQGLGHTQLIISSDDIAQQSIPVYITQAHSLPQGEYQQYSQPLGIVNESATSPDLLLNGPFITQIKVQKGNIEIPVDEKPGIIHSTQVGLVKGSFVSGLSPDGLLAGNDETIMTVSGAGLENVDEIIAYPPEGISIGAFTISENGNEVSFPISLSQDQETGPYQIQLLVFGAPIHTVSANADVFHVSSDVPTLSYVDPILIARDNLLTIDIAGANFDFVKDIRIEPQEGITLASDFSVNNEGTLISQAINVDISAPLGDRVVIVETATGESSLESAENNTLSITNAPGTDISEILSATVGVVKEETLSLNEQSITARTDQLGVVIGAYVKGLTPSRSTVGSTITMTVSGAGLENVTAVDFQPDNGMTISSLNVVSDGLSLTFDLGIEQNAPLTQRQLLLTTSTEDLIPTVSPTADRLDVIAVEPSVASVYPQHIAINKTQIPLTITGSDLDNATVIRFEPANGISVDSFTIAQDGRSIDMLVSTTADAQLGARVLIVETTAGQSSDIASLSNTLTIADEVFTISSLVSPKLGIHKGTTEPPLYQFPALLMSPTLGVVRQFTAPLETGTISQYSPTLGISIGSVATQVSPHSVSIGKAENLVVSGVGLDNVTSVNFEPPEGITITGTINTNNNGEQLIIPVQIAEDAEQSLRELVLTTSDDPISFAPENQGQLLISGLTPEIISLDPIQQTQGASFSLLIRGVNLDDTLVVSASPSTGISFSTPSINAAGTKLTITMIIAPNAPPGARVITVTTPAGSTDNNAIPANTFTIIN